MCGHRKYRLNYYDKTEAVRPQPSGRHQQGPRNSASSSSNVPAAAARQHEDIRQVTEGFRSVVEAMAQQMNQSNQRVEALAEVVATRVPPSHPSSGHPQVYNLHQGEESFPDWDGSMHG